MNNILLIAIVATAVISLLNLFVLSCILNVINESKVSKEGMKPKPALPAMDFDKDFAFLHTLIAHKYRIYKQFFLEPLKEKRATIYREEDFDDLNQRISKDIIRSISPVHKKVLAKYMSEEAITEYVTEKVLELVTDFMVKSNVEIIRSKKTVNLNKKNRDGK